ncbi:MAG: hypothetical protein ACJ8EL_03780 [Rhizomicrobium sp.]
MNSKLHAILVAFAIFVSSPTYAKSNWICLYHPAGQGGAPALRGTLLDDGSGKLSGFTDDYTGKRPQYEVIESSDEGMIAILHSSERRRPSPLLLSIILLDKKTGDLRMIGTRTPGLYEDVWQGQCSSGRR